MDNERDILMVAILTFFTVFVWVFFDLIQTSKKSTITEPVQNLLSPIQANIDTDTLTLLEQRNVYR